MNYSALAKTYCPLLYKNQLAGALNSFFATSKYDNYEKYEMHKEINSILLNNYKGEELYKYLLAKEFYNKKVIAAFEVRVNRSRVDFVTINGISKSFEIKSELDNLYKLPKQVSDYIRVFDFNYIVLSERHIERAIDIIPANYGIISFVNSKKTTHREPTKNNQLDPEYQLKLLTKRELKKGFKETDGDIKQILRIFIDNEINQIFKNILKERYQKRWNFLVENANILPMDVQFFFNTNVSPSIIYGIN